MAIDTSALNANIKASLETFFKRQMGKLTGQEPIKDEGDVAQAMANCFTSHLETWIKTATIEMTVINTNVTLYPIPPVPPLTGSIGHKGVPGSVTTPGGIS